jgi:hypothetical protein
MRETHPGGDAAAKNALTKPGKGDNNVGTAGNPAEVTGKLFSLGEGSPISKLLNQVPSINAVAGMHDMFQIGWEMLGGSWLRGALNYPGMPIAGAMTWMALRDTPYISYDTLRLLLGLGK